MDPTHCGRSPTVKTITLLKNNLVLDIQEVQESIQDFYALELDVKVNRFILISPGSLFTSMSDDSEMIVSIVCEILQSESGDLVMLFLGEFVILMRKDQKLIIDESYDFWNSRNEAALTIPHTSEALPSL